MIDDLLIFCSGLCALVGGFLFFDDSVSLIVTAFISILFMVLIMSIVNMILTWSDNRKNDK